MAYRASNGLCPAGLSVPLCESIVARQVRGSNPLNLWQWILAKMAENTRSPHMVNICKNPRGDSDSYREWCEDCREHAVEVKGGNFAPSLQRYAERLAITAGETGLTDNEYNDDYDGDGNLTFALLGIKRCVSAHKVKIRAIMRGCGIESATISEMLKRDKVASEHSRNWRRCINTEPEIDVGNATSRSSDAGGRFRGWFH